LELRITKLLFLIVADINKHFDRLFKGVNNNICTAIEFFEGMAKSWPVYDNDRFVILFGFCDIAGGIPLAIIFVLFVKKGNEHVAPGDPYLSAQVVDATAEIVFDAREIPIAHITFGDISDLNANVIAEAVIFTWPFEGDVETFFAAHLADSFSPVSMDVPGEIDEEGLGHDVCILSLKMRTW
jgi:hypothetical protein